MRGQEVNCTPGIAAKLVPGVQAKKNTCGACKRLHVLAARLCGKHTATVAVADPPFAERPRPARWVTVPSQTLRPRPCASLGRA